MTPQKYPIKIAGMLFGNKKYYCSNPAGCRKEVLGFKDRQSAIEYGINKLCQECQDEIFAEPKTKTIK